MGFSTGVQTEPSSLFALASCISIALIKKRNKKFIFNPLKKKKKFSLRNFDLQLLGPHLFEENVHAFHPHPEKCLSAVLRFSFQARESRSTRSENVHFNERKCYSLSYFIYLYFFNFPCTLFK